MRIVLVLCLLVFISCQKDIMDIAKCLYENPKMKEIIADVMVAIATKDFSKLWPKIKESLPELIPVAIKCITENEINLEKKSKKKKASECNRCNSDFGCNHETQCLIDNCAKECLSDSSDNDDPNPEK